MSSIFTFIGGVLIVVITHILATFVRDKVNTERSFINDTRNFAADFFGKCYKYLFLLRNSDFCNYAERSKINDCFLDLLTQYPVMLMRLGDKGNRYRQEIVLFTSKLKCLNDVALKNENYCEDVEKLIADLNENIVPDFERNVYYDWENTNQIKNVLKHEWYKLWN